jgi:hypothetical protein
MIDIATVVMREELPMLRLQAESIARHAHGIGVRNIYVVVNDDDAVAREIDAAWWQHMQGQVLVIPRTAFSAPWVEDGWVSQQVWKILTAAMSYNLFTMVMDAKTILTRTIEPAWLFTPDGKLRSGADFPIYDVFQPSRDIIQDVFEIEMTHQAGPGGVPFFFHNDTVRLMIADITVRTMTSFPRWFQDQGRVTEFMLYSGYVQKRYGSLESIYAARAPEMDPINLCHSDTRTFDEFMTDAERRDGVSIGIHRRRWAVMSESERQRYRLFLVDRGITAAWDLA